MDNLIYEIDNLFHTAEVSESNQFGLHVEIPHKSTVPAVFLGSHPRTPALRIPSIFLQPDFQVCESPC